MMNSLNYRIQRILSSSFCEPNITKEFGQKKNYFNYIKFLRILQTKQPLSRLCSIFQLSKNSHIIIIFNSKICKVCFFKRQAHTPTKPTPKSTPMSTNSNPQPQGRGTPPKSTPNVAGLQPLCNSFL